ncbi:hypothetical protein B0813_001147 [Candidatus Fervidibacteria bacterium JGI MDM2 SSWTFF-3-K9]
MGREASVNHHASRITLHALRTKDNRLKESASDDKIFSANSVKG